MVQTESEEAIMGTEENAGAGIRLKLKCDPRQLHSEAVSKSDIPVESAPVVEAEIGIVEVKKAVEAVVAKPESVPSASEKKVRVSSAQVSRAAREKKRLTEAEKNYYKKLFLTLFVFIPLFLLLALFIFCGTVSIYLVGRVAGNAACGDIIHAAALELKLQPLTQWPGVISSAADRIVREPAVPVAESDPGSSDTVETSEENSEQ